jgi:hypothetical protein
VKIEEPGGISSVGWQKLVLSLDKHIESGSQPIKRRYARVAGFILCSLAFLLMLYSGVQVKSALILLAVIYLIDPVCGGLDELGWRSDRWIKSSCEKHERENTLSFLSRYSKINKPTTFCDRGYLTPFPEKGWLRSRFLEHYICTIYEIRSFMFLGWLIALIALAFLNLLVSFITK